MMLPTNATLTVFSSKKTLKKKIKTTKKRKKIGGQAEVPLIATNVFWEIFNKSFENDSDQIGKWLGCN